MSEQQESEQTTETRWAYVAVEPESRIIVMICCSDKHYRHTAAEAVAEEIEKGNIIARVELKRVKDYFLKEAPEGVAEA